MTPMRIVADDRERKSGIPKLLKSLGADLEIQTLPVGDYIVAPETIIERKTVNDFISSVFDGRLFDQCARLKEHFERPALIVEGDLDDLDSLIENPLIFYGAVSKVAMEFQIPVMHTPHAMHTASLLCAMAAKKEGGAKGPYVKRIRKSTDVGTQQLSILCSLPGVGEKFAVRMLERFGTPLNALTATSADLLKVEGMGESRVGRIRDVLTSNIANPDDTTGEQTRLAFSSSTS